MKDLGNVDHILGVTIQKNKASGIVILDQSIYIRKFLKDYKIENSHPVSTLVDKYEFLTIATNTKPRIDQFEYQKMIESLMYAMTSTRLDIAFAISKISQFSHDLYVRHRVSLDRIMRYL